MAEITKTVIEEVLDVVPTLELTPEKSGEDLFQLGLDSLDHATILLALEERLDCKFPDNDVDMLTSVDAIVQYVESQRAA